MSEPGNHFVSNQVLDIQFRAFSLNYTQIYTCSMRGEVILALYRIVGKLDITIKQLFMTDKHKEVYCFYFRLYFSHVRT